MGFIENEGLWDVECDGCRDLLGVEARASHSLHSAAKTAKWKFVGDDWLCTKCVSKNKTQPKGLSSKPTYQLKRTPIIVKKQPQLARSPLKQGKGLTPKPFNPDKPKKAPSLKKTRIKPSTTPINKVSEKMKVKNDKYYKVRDQQLLDHPVCQYPGCYKRATDVHHVRGRDGENRYNHLKSLCRPHHDYVERNREWAISQGLLESHHWSFETKRKP